MFLKKNYLKRYLWNVNIYYIISHHWWVYIKLIVWYSIILVILFSSYSVVKYFGLQNVYVNYIFWFIWVVVYVKFTIDFFDYYLDSLVITEYGVYIFLWDWILKYSKELIEWEGINAVYDNQNWFWDVILNKWDLKIKREVIVYTFEEVPNPRKVSVEIMKYKDKFTKEKEEKKEVEENIDNEKETNE